MTFNEWNWTWNAIAIAVVLLVLSLLVSTWLPSGYDTHVLEADGTSDLKGKSAVVGYPTELAAEERYKAAEFGQAWWAFVSDARPSSLVQLSDWPDRSAQNSRIRSLWAKEYSAEASEAAGEKVRPERLVVDGRKAHRWTFYDPARGAEVRDLWVQGLNGSFRLRCVLYEFDFNRGDRLCKASTQNLEVQRS